MSPLFCSFLLLPWQPESLGVRSVERSPTSAAILSLHCSWLWALLGLKSVESPHFQSPCSPSPPGWKTSARTTTSAATPSSPRGFSRTARSTSRRSLRRTRVLSSPSSSMRGTREGWIPACTRVSAHSARHGADTTGGSRARRPSSSTLQVQYCVLLYCLD